VVEDCCFLLSQQPTKLKVSGGESFFSVEKFNLPQDDDCIFVQKDVAAKPLPQNWWSTTAYWLGLFFLASRRCGAGISSLFKIRQCL